MTPPSRGAIAPELSCETTLKIKEGAGNARCFGRTHSLAWRCEEPRKLVTTGAPLSPAFPARWFYDFLRALPGDQALLSPSPAKRLADLTPALGRQNHTSSSSADQRRSSASPSASIAPRSTFVTTRTSLLPERDGRLNSIFSEKAKVESCKRKAPRGGDPCHDDRGADCARNRPCLTLRTTSCAKLPIRFAPDSGAKADIQ
jgi:hypothetical protein